MSVAASTQTGKNFFLFGKKSSCWYDIESATAPSTQPVTTTSECHPLPALTIDTPRAVNVNGTIYVFGKVILSSVFIVFASLLDMGVDKIALSVLYDHHLNICPIFFQL